MAPRRSSHTADDSTYSSNSLDKLDDLLFEVYHPEKMSVNDSLFLHSGKIPLCLNQQETSFYDGS